ncbi:hypothetical protein Tco_0514059 [Tanacetum coccineum]
MLLCKQKEARVQLSAEQQDWLIDSDEKPTNQELEAHYLYMENIQEAIPTAYKATRPVFEKEPVEQEERALLASSIEKMKLEIDESKRFNKQLKKANTSLATKMDRYKDMKCVKEAEFECGKLMSIQTMDMLNSKCTSSFAKPRYIKKAQSAKPCLYDLVCNRNVLANKFACDSDETIYSWIVPGRHNVQRVLELQLAPTVEHTTKHVTNFKQTLKEDMVEDLIYFNSLEKEVESLQSQLELQRTQLSNKN